MEPTNQKETSQEATRLSQVIQIDADPRLSPLFRSSEQGCARPYKAMQSMRRPPLSPSIARSGPETWVTQRT
jgi:hypothetical protein